MKTKETKTFDSIAFFRSVEEKLANQMEGMTLAQKKDIMQYIRKNKIKIA